MKSQPPCVRPACSQRNALIEKKAMDDIAANYARVSEQVARAAERAGRRADEVTLVCAAKTKGPELVRAALHAGATDIGENYVQEAQHKVHAVPESATWHLIGHLQRNKAKIAVPLFHLIHSLDSLPLAKELDRQGAKQGATVHALIEVNLAAEETKAGVRPDAIDALLEGTGSLSHLRIDGFMAIPPAVSDPNEARPYFRALARLREHHATMGAKLPELSMGMTQDFVIAIEEGATIVRVGRAIFGER